MLIYDLKNLGLTISYNPGYTLSSRGEAFFTSLSVSGMC